MKREWLGVAAGICFAIVFTVATWKPDITDGQVRLLDGASITPPREECGQEKQHIYLLKVHKSGSTTLQNNMLRFGATRNLNILTMFSGFKSYPKVEFDRQLPSFPPAGLVNGKYDIYCEHSIYDEEYLSGKLHEDTFNVAILREPMSQLRSTFSYYGLAETMKLSQNQDPVATFLEKPSYYCDKYKGRTLELTHNRIPWEFGYKERKHNMKDYMVYIESKFLVLIMERLPESLVLMKRKLCWGMKDILFAQARKGSYKKPAVNQTLVRLHKAWSPRDYELYAHFHAVMDRTLDQQDADFAQEVRLFERYLEQLRKFCDGICAQMGQLRKTSPNADPDTADITYLLDNKTTFPGNHRNLAFSVTGLDCLMMRFDPTIYRQMQKVRLYPEFCTSENKTIQKLKINREYCGETFKYAIPWNVLRHPKFVDQCF